MRVLVTGGTGLVGSAVCAALAAAGADPVCYDLAPLPEQLGPLAGQIPVERGDILDLPALLRALRQHRVEAVVHTAADPDPVAVAYRFPPTRRHDSGQGAGDFCACLRRPRMHGCELRRAVSWTAPSPSQQDTQDHAEPARRGGYCRVEKVGGFLRKR